MSYSPSIFVKIKVQYKTQMERVMPIKVSKEKLKDELLWIQYVKKKQILWKILVSGGIPIRKKQRGKS